MTLPQAPKIPDQQLFAKKTGGGVGFIIGGSVLSFLSVFSLPRGISLFILALARPESGVNPAEAAGGAFVGAILLAGGISLIVVGVRRRRRNRSAR